MSNCKVLSKSSSRTSCKWHVNIYFKQIFSHNFVYGLCCVQLLILNISSKFLLISSQIFYNNQELKEACKVGSPLSQLSKQSPHRKISVLRKSPCTKHPNWLVTVFVQRSITDIQMETASNRSSTRDALCSHTASQPSECEYASYWPNRSQTIVHTAMDFTVCSRRM